jgi:hypothetical protein
VPYAAVNGLNMYYEVHREGPPLLLLHGGLGLIAPTLIIVGDSDIVGPEHAVEMFRTIRACEAVCGSALRSRRHAEGDHPHVPAGSSHRREVGAVSTVPVQGCRYREDSNG